MEKRSYPSVCGVGHRVASRVHQRVLCVSIYVSIYLYLSRARALLFSNY